MKPGTSLWIMGFCFLLVTMSTPSLFAEQIATTSSLASITDFYDAFPEQTTVNIAGQKCIIPFLQERIWYYQRLVNEEKKNRLLNPLRQPTFDKYKQAAYVASRSKDILRKILREGEIVDVESLGGGNHASWKAFVKRIDPLTGECFAVKVAMKFHLADRDTDAYSEVSAYEWDQQLGRSNVPMAILREFNGKRCSLMVFIGGDHARVANNSALPKQEFQKIGNEDRFFAYTARHWDLDAAQNKNMGNLIWYVSQDPFAKKFQCKAHTALIDFSWAFRSGDLFHELIGKASWKISGDNIYKYLSSQMYPSYVTYKNYDFEKLKADQSFYTQALRHKVERIEMLKKRRDQFVNAVNNAIQKKFPQISYQQADPATKQELERQFFSTL
ncbi:MAG: hypothetical protein HQK50_10675 [Oligoflexia bacterium]|nr:hypothetical protein [Oligoflexia bacterium]MBF0366025.1 hypothetical protein [Oligoflexia bacterium]